MKNKIIALVLALTLLAPSCLSFADASDLFVAACDINGDGKVNSADARLILRRAARLDYLDKTLAAVDKGIAVFGDMNGSGGVTSADARLLLGYVSRRVDESVFTFMLRPTEPTATEPTTLPEPTTAEEGATRDDMNELIDDTTAAATVSAPEERITDLVDDPSRPGKTPTSAVILSEGVDISHHNGRINWSVMKDQIDWVILRCGYGGDFTDQDDHQWEYNASSCEALGIPYGVYLYSYADTVAKAESEAAHALRLLAGHHPQLPVYYDLEEDGIARRVPKSRFLEMSKLFCARITAAGYEFGVYANLNWWNNYLTDPWYDNYSRWIAVYRDVFVYDGEYDIWQYTSTGRIEGFSGIFDLNHAYYPFDLTPHPVESVPETTQPATAPPEPGTVWQEQPTIPTLPTTQPQEHTTGPADPELADAETTSRRRK